MFYFSNSFLEYYDLLTTGLIDNNLIVKTLIDNSIMKIYLNFWDLIFRELYYELSLKLDEKSSGLVDIVGDENVFLNDDEVILRQNDDSVKHFLYGNNLFLDHEVLDSLGFNGNLFDEDFRFLISLQIVNKFLNINFLFFQNLFISIYKFFNLLFVNIFFWFKFINLSRIVFFFKKIFKIISWPLYFIFYFYGYCLFILFSFLNICFLSYKKLFNNVLYYSKTFSYFSLQSFYYIIFYCNCGFVYLYYFIKTYFNFKFYNINLSNISLSSVFIIDIKKYILFFFNIFIKIFCFYLLFIWFFLQYDNFIFFIESYLHLAVSVRTFSLFYTLLFFLLLVIILNPFSRFGKELWVVRYEFLMLVLWFWYISGFVNSLHIFFSEFWDNLNLVNYNFNGFSFYEKFFYDYINSDVRGLESYQDIFSTLWYNYLITWGKEANQFFEEYYVYQILRPGQKFLRSFFRSNVYQSSMYISFFEYSNFFKIFMFKNFGELYIPIYLHLLLFLEFFKGNPFYFIYLFDKFFYTRGIEGSIFLYNLNGFEISSFYKNVLNSLYVDMWKMYKPKTEHLINFYQRTDRAYSNFDILYFGEYNVDLLPGVVGFGTGKTRRGEIYKYYQIDPDDPVRFKKYIYRHKFVPEKDFTNRFVIDRFTNYTERSEFFNKILLPDLAFIGSSTWFYDSDLIQMDHRIKSDGFFGLRYLDDNVT